MKKWSALLLVLSFVAGGLVPRHRTVDAATASVLTIGVLALPTTLNPLLDGSGAARDVTTALFESLLTTDTHDALQPALAQSYTISKNGLTYSFALDPRARWQDDVPVTADDVLFTAKLMRDPKFPAYNRYGFGLVATLSADGTTHRNRDIACPIRAFFARIRHNANSAVPCAQTDRRGKSRPV